MKVLELKSGDFIYFKSGCVSIYIKGTQDGDLIIPYIYDKANRVASINELNDDEEVELWCNKYAIDQITRCSGGLTEIIYKAYKEPTITIGGIEYSKKEVEDKLKDLKPI